MKCEKYKVWKIDKILPPTPISPQREWHLLIFFVFLLRCLSDPKRCKKLKFHSGYLLLNIKLKEILPLEKWSKEIKFWNLKTKLTSGRGRLWGPLLICLLNLTVNKKSSLHSLQFPSKYHVSLDGLWRQIWEYTYRNSVMAALYYDRVELEKM